LPPDEFLTSATWLATTDDDAEWAVCALAGSAKKALLANKAMVKALLTLLSFFMADFYLSNSIRNLC
jgi:hypothetical protein